MKVILLQKIRKLGDLGSEITVRKGYGRNYLIPKGLAVPATKDNLASFNAQRAIFEKAASEAFSKAQIRAKELQGIEISISARASDEGRLFGSVSMQEIKESLHKAGFEIDKNEVRLLEPIRQIGDYEVELQLHHDVSTLIKLTVIAD